MITIHEAVAKLFAIVVRNDLFNSRQGYHCKETEALSVVLEALRTEGGREQVISAVLAEAGPSPEPLKKDGPSPAFTKFAEDLWKDLAAGGRPIPPVRVARPPYREGICPRDGSPCESAGNGSKCCGEILK